MRSRSYVRSAHDVPAAERERQENWFDHFKQRVHLTEISWLRIPRNFGRMVREGWVERPHPTVLREVERALERAPDIVLLSAYFQHFNSVKEIGERALKRRIPVLLGGAMFNNDEAAAVWRTIPGLAAVVGAELGFRNFGARRGGLQSSRVWRGFPA